MPSSPGLLFLGLGLALLARDDALVDPPLALLQWGGEDGGEVGTHQLEHPRWLHDRGPVGVLKRADRVAVPSADSCSDVVEAGHLSVDGVYLGAASGQRESSLQQRDDELLVVDGVGAVLASLVHCLVQTLLQELQHGSLLLARLACEPGEEAT